MRIGLIAGNGRFPFLVLEAARAQGHDVTIIAAKEEAFPELNDAALRTGAAIHWISIGHLGKCIGVLKDAGSRPRRSRRISTSATGWPTRSRRSISDRRLR